MTTEDIQSKRDRMLRTVVWAYLGLSVIAYVCGVGPAIANADWSIVAFNTLMLGGVATAAFRTKLSFGARAGIIIGLTYAIGVYFTYRFGPLAAGPLWLFATPLLVAALLSRTAAVASVVTVSITVVLFGALLCVEAVPWAAEVNLGSWIPLSGSFVALNVLLTLNVAALFRHLREANTELERATVARVRAVERLRETQKLEALGLLAGVSRTTSTTSSA